MAQPIPGRRPGLVPARFFVGEALPSIGVSVAVTDGADVLASSISVLVSASSATTDGADVSVASVSVVVAAASATTDGTDIYAIAVGPVVAASSATTDGADVLASSVSVRVTVSSASTDGADVMSALLLAPVIVTSATTDGADICAAAVSTGTTPFIAAPQAGAVDLLIPSSFDNTNQGAWEDWHLLHIVSHEEIFKTMLTVGQIAGHYPLDYDPKNERWKEVHAQEHDNINQVLGISPVLPNLADVDLNDPDEFDNWMYNHAIVHQQIRTALGM